MQDAWYARRGGKAHEFYTILHLPYTSMVLSYVLIGAALSPTLHFDRLILTLLAYFLGLGISAHALNELCGRHWGKALSSSELKILFLVPLLAALIIGAYGMFVLYAASYMVGSVILLIFIVAETFFIFAYNTRLSGEKFHNDIAFAFSWALLPTLSSYFVNALNVTVSIVLVALALGATAAIEINLSRWCKSFRRRGPLSEVRFRDGTRTRLSTQRLIGKPEKALKLIVVTVDLLGIGLLVRRLIGW